MPPVPYPPLRGNGILVSPPSPWREGFWTSPSFLWKEVPRRGGGWLPQRDELKYETARPPVSSSRAQPRDLSCRSGVRHACGCSENRSGAHLMLSVSPVCKGRFLASLEMTIRGRLTMREYHHLTWRRRRHLPPLNLLNPLNLLPLFHKQSRDSTLYGLTPTLEPSPHHVLQ